MRQVLRTIVVSVVMWSVSWAAPALADTWQLDAEALTDIPVQVGAGLVLKSPDHLRFKTSVGFLPTPYVDIINSAVVAFDGYNETTADVITSALENSLVWRTHVGYHPGGSPFYFEVGYGFVGFGGGLTGEQLLIAITGVEVMTPPDTGTRNYTVDSTLHMVDVEVGWVWEEFDPLIIRTGLGFAGTLSASTTVKADFESTSPQVDARIETFAEDYLNDIYTSYVFSPVFTVAVAYRALD